MKFNLKLEQPMSKVGYQRLFECRNICIDYGIMEKAENAYVICSEFG